MDYSERDPPAYFVGLTGCLRGGTFFWKNPSPIEANTSVRLIILSGILVVKKIYATSNSLNRTRLYKDILYI
jgi:hypothetical protein